jgi:hypothetical protein
VMNDVQFSFLYEVLREAYVEMYSPSHLKVVGSVAGPIRDEAEDVGERAVDADMGEPSPKMARTGDMLFVGPSETVQEERKQVERKAMNADAVTANSMVAPGAEEGVPYSTLGTDTGREERPPKRD